MITVELRSIPENEDEYRSVASLTVADDGTHEFEDPRGLFPFEVPVPVPVEGADGELTLGQVWFSQAPEEWARNLENLLRTGYLVPVVTVDEPQAGESMS